MQPARPSPRFRVTAARYLHREAEGVAEAVAVEEAVAEVGEAEAFRTFPLCGSHNRNRFLPRRAFIAFPGLLAAAVDAAVVRQSPAGSL